MELFKCTGETITLIRTDVSSNPCDESHYKQPLKCGFALKSGTAQNKSRWFGYNALTIRDVWPVLILFQVFQSFKRHYFMNW